MYQGSANYQTWSVGLILGNDRSLYEDMRTIAREAFAAEEDPELKRARVADALRAWVTNEVADVFEQARTQYIAGSDFLMLADQLVTGALSEVDWFEIADDALEV